MVYVHIILQGNGIDKLVTQESDQYLKQLPYFCYTSGLVVRKLLSIW